jgi:hypothetical protein
VIAFILIGVNICGQILKYRYGVNVSWFLPTYDLSLEQNIPTFYSVLLMLFISLLTGIVSFLNYKNQKHYTFKWIALSVGFLYMAYDEGFHVHEDLVGLIRPMLWEGRLGIFYYAWVIPGIILVIFLFLFFFRFLRFLSGRYRTLFIASAVIYLSGVIGMELVGGYYDEIHGMQNLFYNMISALEESLEIFGLIFFIYALLEYISSEYQEIRLGFNHH